MTSAAPAEGDREGLRIHPEVLEALDARTPIVALESTIISHGLPRPRNHEAALEFESILRDAGVTPATIAVLDGVPQIGLDADGVRRIAEEELAKASVRDLPIIAAAGSSAATTVAATSHLAALEHDVVERVLLIESAPALGARQGRQVAGAIGRRGVFGLGADEGQPPALARKAPGQIAAKVGVLEAASANAVRRHEIARRDRCGQRVEAQAERQIGAQPAGQGECEAEHRHQSCTRRLR